MNNPHLIRNVLGIEKNLRMLLAFFPLLAIFNGCSTKAGMFVSANIAPLRAEKFEFSDGYTGTYYVHQKGDKEKTDVALFFVGGSGHTSHNYYLRQYFNDMPGNITIYALQKRHVGHRETGMRKASKEFDFFNHHPQLVQDQKEFVLWALKNKGIEHKKVVLFGVSEGGNIAVQLASEIKEISHLMILGSGGMPAIDEFRIWGKRYNMDFDRLYQEVKKHPNDIERRAVGQTYKYWSSILPFEPMAYFDSLSIPILVAIGEKDEMAPVESVHFLRSEFDRLGKSNLSVKTFPNCNHALDDSNGINHRAAFFSMASDWWNGK